MCYSMSRLLLQGWQLGDKCAECKQYNDTKGPSHFGDSTCVIPLPDRLESSPALANGAWIVATMPPRIQSDLEAV
jgi:hypothetical protein